MKWIIESGKKCYVSDAENLKEKPCPTCGFEHAEATYFSERRGSNVFCPRCGFCEDTEFENENNQFSRLQVYKEQVRGGESGSYLIVKKEASGVIRYGAASKETPKLLEENISQFLLCGYTFFSKGKWFVQDLIAKKTLPFTNGLLVTLLEEKKKAVNDE